MQADRQRGDAARTPFFTPSKTFSCQRAVSPLRDLRVVAMLSSIEAGLSRPWYRLRLPADLEARFVAQDSIGGARRIRSWMGVFLIFNLLSLKIDLDKFGPDAFAVPAALTLGLIVPVTLVAMLLLRGVPSPRRQTGAVLVPSLVSMGVVLNSARVVPVSHADTYLMLAAIIPLVVGMIAPMSFRHSLVYCGACFALYAGANAAFVLSGDAGSGVPLFVASLILVPLKLSYSREWETKQGFLLGLRDQTLAAALARDNTRLTILSETDPLTEVANRRLFDDRLDAAWTSAGEAMTWLGVALIDIDHFKAFNDAAGHDAGDHCLRAVAAALAGAVAMQGGLLARYGGEEFAVMCPGADPERMLAVAEGLHRAVSALALNHPGLNPGAHVSVSVGTTCSHGATARLGVTADALLRVADRALYDAKRTGRDRVGVASVELSDAVRVPSRAARA